MKSIVGINQLNNLKKVLKDKKVVLVGGCFDILHPGHVIFLQKAKKEGEILVVLLESDQKIKKLKGTNRPLYTQTDRAIILSALKFVDFVILLTFMDQEEDYDQLVGELRPSIIAATKDSKGNVHKLRAAKLVGAKLKYVTAKIGNYSSSIFWQKK